MSPGTGNGYAEALEQRIQQAMQLVSRLRKEKERP